MFDNKKDNETDFCESYKSQILGVSVDEPKPSLFSTFIKLLTILILLVIIVAVSFYGYNYYRSHQMVDELSLPPISVQVSDDDLVVEDEEPQIEEVEKLIEVEEKNMTIMTTSLPEKEEELDIEQIANDVKVAIAQSETDEEALTELLVAELSEVEVESAEVIQEENVTNISVEENISTNITIEPEVKSLEVPTLSPEAKYLEELADLSKEIDKERKK